MFLHLKLYFLSSVTSLLLLLFLCFVLFFIPLYFEGIYFSVRNTLDNWHRLQTPSQSRIQRHLPRVMRPQHGAQHSHSGSEWVQQNSTPSICFPDADRDSCVCVKIWSVTWLACVAEEGSSGRNVMASGRNVSPGIGVLRRRSWSKQQKDWIMTNVRIWGPAVGWMS